MKTSFCQGNFHNFDKTFWNSLYVDEKPMIYILIVNLNGSSISLHYQSNKSRTSLFFFSLLNLLWDTPLFFILFHSIICVFGQLLVCQSWSYFNLFQNFIFIYKIKSNIFSYVTLKKNNAFRDRHEESKSLFSPYILRLVPI